MLERPLQFIASSLDEYVKLKTQSSSSEKIVIATELVNDQGKFSLDQGTIGISVINIQEERINKQQSPEPIHKDGQLLYLNPEVRLKMSLLFVANYKDYTDSIKAISQIVSYFQSNNVFRPETYPALDASIEKLIFELGTQSFEELSYIWGVLGTSYRPSVIYNMRLVAVQEGVPRRAGANIGTTDYQLGGV